MTTIAASDRLFVGFDERYRGPGVVQPHLQRILGMIYMEVRDQIAPFYWMRLGSNAFAAHACVAVQQPLTAK